MNILFTCVGRRNYLLRYFREAMRDGDQIIACDMQASAPGLTEADRAFLVPAIYDESYIPTLLGKIREYQVDALISLNDLELPILSAHRKEIEELGAKLLVSDERVIDITFDKLKTAAFLREECGLQTPYTETSLEAFCGSSQSSYPCVLKPRWGSASIGIEFPQSEEELLIADKLLRIKLKNTILYNASKEHFASAILYQEKIIGREYGMDILNDLEGNYVGTFVREKLAMRAGETDKARTIIDDRFEHIGRKISKHLRHIGVLDCDVLEREGELYVLEMNARFGGGYPFSHEAGEHATACILEWLQGGGDIAQHLQYKAGITLSKCDRLIRVLEHL